MNGDKLKVLFVSNTLEITAAYLRGEPVDDLYSGVWEDEPAADAPVLPVETIGQHERRKICPNEKRNQRRRECG